MAFQRSLLSLSPLPVPSYSILASQPHHLSPPSSIIFPSPLIPPGFSPPALESYLHGS